MASMIVPFGILLPADPKGCLCLFARTCYSWFRSVFCVTMCEPDSSGRDERGSSKQMSDVVMEPVDVPLPET